MRMAAASDDVVGYVVLTFRVYQEGDQYVSECVELGTASCGDSIDEAFANIKEATLLYLNAIEESGERERIFRRRNIRIYLGQPHHEKMSVTASDRDVVSLFVHPLPAVTHRHGSAAAVL